MFDAGHPIVKWNGRAGIPFKVLSSCGLKYHVDC